MSELLYKSLHEHVRFTDEEWRHCKSSFRPKRMLKRQFFLQEGNVCRDVAFVEKGALCSYSLDAKGNQHVIRFAFDGWWVADLQSFFTEKPSTFHIEVLEECELLLLEREKHEELIQEIPSYERYHRIILQNAYVALQQRVENALGRTAEEKYARLMEYKPDLIHRVPLNLVASYLGITSETLSRVRRQYASN